MSEVNSEEPVGESASTRVSKRGRYPSFPLEKAVQYARSIYEKERLNPTPIEAIYDHVGYGPKSSQGRMVCATLVQFGLARYTGTKRLQITQDASTIISFPENSGDCLRRAATMPRLFKALWDQFGSDLPSEQSLGLTLHREFNFGPDVAKRIVRIFVRP